MTQRGIEASEVLYEAVMVAVSHAAASGVAAGDARGEELGRWILRYLGAHGLPLGDTAGAEGLRDLLARFVEAGFAHDVEVSAGSRGLRCVWRGVRGLGAWEALGRSGVSPFLASPAGLALRYLARRQGRCVRLHRERLDAPSATLEVELELVEAPRDEAIEADAAGPTRELRGIIPICAGCKKIRAPRGWQPVEAYIEEHSQASFSHGICPECLDRLYPTLSLDDSRG